MKEVIKESISKRESGQMGTTELPEAEPRERILGNRGVESIPTIPA